MNTKALITTLAVLGSASSLAMARPAPQPSISATAQVSWNTGAPVRAYAPSPALYTRDHRAPYVAPARVIVRPIVRPVVLSHGQDPYWTQGDRWGYQPQPRETILADGLTYNVGEYRKDIVLEGRGRFNTLALDEENGCDFIKEVRIEFMDGAVQSIPVNQNLTPGRPMTFDLDGHDRAVNRIFVYRADGGAGANIGIASRGEFSVAAL